MRRYIRGVFIILILSTIIFGSGVKPIQSKKGSGTLQIVCDKDTLYQQGNLVSLTATKSSTLNIGCSRQKVLDRCEQSSYPNVFNAPHLEKTIKISSGVYEDHDPISINGNADFSSQATTETWPGDGTESSPYIIDGLSITGLGISDTLIEIRNTDVYFRISNCFLVDGANGLSFNDVENGEISNNIITNTVGGGNGRYGIQFMGQSDNNDISDNFLYNHEFAIHLEEPGDNTLIFNNSVFSNINGLIIKGNNNRIANNSVYDNGMGIGLFESKDSTISGNSIYNNNDTGINLGSSNNNIVSGNDVYNTMNGIYLYECDKNTISNNIVFNSSFGIWVDESSNNLITSNSVSDNDNHGIIIVSHSKNNLISNNFVFNNIILGIEITNSNYNTVTNNTLTNNEIGLWSGESEYNSIILNTVYSNVVDGITLYICTDFIVSSNTIFNNGNAGISLQHSSNNNLSSNTLRNNGWFGIILTDNFPEISDLSNNNIILCNNFIDNFNAIGSQASDRTFFCNSVFSNNYWNDWTSPDDNGDGIVDNSYYVHTPLTSSSSDSLPLVIVHEFIGLLNVTQPIGELTLAGSVDIEWEPENDSITHHVTYSVYYSSDGGKSWTLLTSGLTANRYSWNTTTLTGDATYKIKVVTSCSEGLMTEDTSEVTFTEVEVVKILNIITLTTIEFEMLIAIFLVVLLSIPTLLMIIWIVKVPIKRRREKRRREEIRRIWRY